VIRILDRAGVIFTLSLPLALLHIRGLAEILFVVLSVLFLVRSIMLRDATWLGAWWMRIGLVWWAWLVLCTVLAGGGLGPVVQALGMGRFLLLAMALGHWTLRDGTIRTWLARLLRWAALYIGLQSLLQFAVGVNLYGYPRSGDGELTGPYAHPRAGPPLARLLFPALLPPLGRLLAGPGWRPVAGAALAVGSVVTMVLIGQRMPLLLSVFGLFITALLLPRLRGAMFATCIAASLMLTATSVVSPPAFYRLVTKFSRQMEDFPDSHYGQIAARSLAISAAHPVFGTGFDGFRTGCEQQQYFVGWHGDDGGAAAMCVQHPHSHYMQALVESGWPGLVLFCALVLAWLQALGRGLWRDPTPLRVGIFVAALLHEWPIASTSAFSSMPLSGWFFVLLGLGLAETRAYMTAKPVRETV